jgi:hypothetical protein
MIQCHFKMTSLQEDYARTVEIYIFFKQFIVTLGWLRDKKIMKDHLKYLFLRRCSVTLSVLREKKIVEGSKTYILV